MRLSRYHEVLSCLVFHDHVFDLWRLHMYTCAMGSLGCCRNGTATATETNSLSCRCRSYCDLFYSSETTNGLFSSTACLHFEVGCCRTLENYAETDDPQAINLGLWLGVAFGSIFVFLIIWLPIRLCLPQNTQVAPEEEIPLELKDERLNVNGRGISGLYSKELSY